MVAGLTLPEEPSAEAEPVCSERTRMNHGARWEEQAQRKCLVHRISVLPAPEPLCWIVTGHEVSTEWEPLLLPPQRPKAHGY